MSLNHPSHDPGGVESCSLTHDRLPPCSSYRQTGYLHIHKSQKVVGLVNSVQNPMIDAHIPSLKYGDLPSSCRPSGPTHSALPSSGAGCEAAAFGPCSGVGAAPPSLIRRWTEPLERTDPPSSAPNKQHTRARAVPTNLNRAS